MAGSIEKCWYLIVLTKCIEFFKWVHELRIPYIALTLTLRNNTPIGKSMKKKTKITLATVSVVSLLLTVALVVAYQRPPKASEPGTFIKRLRTTISVENRPVDGNTCQSSVVYEDAEGEHTGRILGGDSFAKLEGISDTSAVDADIEVYVGECCPVVPEPGPYCQRTEEIRIKKVYN